MNNERSHFHLSYFHSRLIPINLSNLVPISIGIPREGWESHIFSFPCTSLVWFVMSFCKIAYYFLVLIVNFLINIQQNSLAILLDKNAIHFYQMRDMKSGILIGPVELGGLLA